MAAKNIRSNKSLKEVFGLTIKKQKARLEILEELVHHLEYRKNDLFLTYGYMLDENGDKVYETDSEGNPVLNNNGEPKQKYGEYTLTEGNTSEEEWAEIMMRNEFYQTIAESLGDLVYEKGEHTPCQILKRNVTSTGKTKG